MIKLYQKAVINFKNIDIDLTELAFNILKQDFSNIIEMFRLEGRRQPIIRQAPIEEFKDEHYSALLKIWESSDCLIGDVPNISDLPIENIVDVAGNLRIFKTVKEEGDFEEYDIYPFIENGTYDNKKVRLSDIIKRSNSVIAIMYYSCLYACSISMEPIHSMHWSRDKDGRQEPWITMYLPFATEGNNIADAFLLLQKRI
ncbi:MAG: hypothetical protein AAF621_08250 [Pseudomonadota bacterium]